MAKYQEQHYEDVARLVAGMVRCQFCVPGGASAHEMGDYFADLFAADNPACCTHCGGLDTTMVCVMAGGRCFEEHNFEGGFDRERFLKDCGLEA